MRDGIGVGVDTKDPMAPDLIRKWPESIFLAIKLDLNFHVFGRKLDNKNEPGANSAIFCSKLNFSHFFTCFSFTSVLCTFKAFDASIGYEQFLD